MRYQILVGVFFCIISNISAQNIILNSSFEYWIDSVGVRMPFAWYTSEATDSGSAIRVSDTHSGLYALRLNGSDTTAFALTASICFSNNTYSFSGWCKTNAIIAGSFIINWFNLSGSVIGSPVIIPIYHSLNWQRYHQIVTCPESATVVTINIVALPYISLIVDDVTLTDTILNSIAENTCFHRKTINYQLYPNPVKNYLYLNKHVDENIQILIFDINGNKRTLPKQDNNSHWCIDCQNLPSGIYFVELISTSKHQIEKIIVKH